MRPLAVVLLDPLIQVSLHRIQRRIELLAEGDGIELILDGAMEAFTDAVGLWIAVVTGLLTIILTGLRGGIPLWQRLIYRELLTAAKRSQILFQYVLSGVYFALKTKLYIAALHSAFATLRLFQPIQLAA